MIHGVHNFTNQTTTTKMSFPMRTLQFYLSFHSHSNHRCIFPNMFFRIYYVHFVLLCNGWCFFLSNGRDTIFILQFDTLEDNENNHLFC